MGCENKESRVCTKIVSTRLEGKQQHETITIRRKQGRGLMRTDGGFAPIMDGMDTQMPIECWC